ncbi:MAG: Mur ligase domain-containing protein, partial [Actinomycetia bacterium]|nr:Mur ligase domain-containing protein [Actinomycetes bacterium]
MLLSELLRNVEEKRIAGFRDVDVSGLAYDSRLLEPGQAFFCIKGLVTDGHLYASDAVSGGASVLFAEREPEGDVGREVVVITVPDTRRTLAACS